jgi:hypothetical protein
MTRRTRGAADRDLKEVRTLEMMLDYAIVEGAELRLPLFVLLLRAARLELMTGVGAGGGSGDRRGASKANNSIAREDAGFVVAPEEVLASCRHLIQDR